MLNLRALEPTTLRAATKLLSMYREGSPPHRDQEGKPIKTGYSKAALERVDKLLKQEPQEFDQETFDKNTERFLKLDEKAIVLLTKLEKKQRR